MTRLLIVEKDFRPLHGIAATLGQRPNIQVVGVANNVAEAMAHIRECDMLLVSAGLPDDGALELVRQVSRNDPWVKVLVTDLQDARGSVPYIDAGAMGWVL